MSRRIWKATSYGTLKNKKIVLSKHVTFNETSLLKFIISQHVERLKTKNVSQRVEVDATSPPLVGLVSVEISSWYRVEIM